MKTLLKKIRKIEKEMERKTKSMIITYTDRYMILGGDVDDKDGVAYYKVFLPLKTKGDE